MKILHVIYSLDTGGAQRMVADLATSMAARPQCRVTVLTYIPAPDSPLEKQIKSDPRIDFECLGLSSDKDLSIILKLRKYLREADVAHIHLFPSIYLAAIANLGIGIPLVYTEHSTHNRRRDIPFLRYAEQWAYSKYKAIGCISEAVKDNLEKWIGRRDTSRIHVIPNGVDLSRFKDLKLQNPEEVFGIKGTPLLMISRFTPAKDQPTLIRALRFLPEDVYAVFAGDGPTLEECKKLAEETGVFGRTVFLGDCKDVLPLLSAAAIGVQASHWEGFGLTVVEMMAAGLPVVASDVPGLNEVASGAGLLYEASNPQSLAHNIKLLLTDPILKEDCIQSGKRKAGEYDSDSPAQAYIRLYNNFLR